MIVGQATGSGWQERLARLAAPYVPEAGFTLVTLDHTGTVDVRKTYDTRTAAFGQATRIGDQTQANAYVLTKHEGRVVVWTGPRATLIGVSVQKKGGRVRI